MMMFTPIVVWSYTISGYSKDGPGKAPKGWVPASPLYSQRGYNTCISPTVRDGHIFRGIASWAVAPKSRCLLSFRPQGPFLRRGGGGGGGGHPYPRGGGTSQQSGASQQPFCPTPGIDFREFLRGRGGGGWGSQPTAFFLTAWPLDVSDAPHGVAKKMVLIHSTIPLSQHPISYPVFLEKDSHFWFSFHWKFCHLMLLMFVEKCIFCI